MEMRDELISLATIADLDGVLRDESTILLFKHSTACPISANAYRELLDWFDAATDAPRVGLVLVIEQRPVSNAIAERLAVKHQSPQAILVAGRRVAWTASHQRITATAIAAAVASVSGET